MKWLNKPFHIFWNYIAHKETLWTGIGLSVHYIYPYNLTGFTFAALRVKCSDNSRLLFYQTLIENSHQSRSASLLLDTEVF